MSGIAAVVKLNKAGYTDLTVFEKADRVGGTWHENTYPGLSCDVPSRWYCFSFALKPDWSHRYSYGSEIQAYMEQVAEDFGVTQRTRFNTAVTDLRYQDGRWQLTTKTGEPETYDVVISATGILHKPVYPAIEGLATYAGDCFHSARWDHSVDLKDKRVGVIGTGSTAAQIIGAVTKDVSEMHVFQRTPQWLVPLPQTTYSRAWNTAYKLLPFMQRLAYHVYLRKMVHMFSAATVGSKFWQKQISKTAQQHLEDGVADKQLRSRLTPDYQATCKRLIFCSDFYPAISSPHAHLVTESIEKIEPQGIRTSDGALHEVDVLVLATGFDAAAFILPTKVTGANNTDLEQQWHGAPRAHRSVAIPNFPNFWMLEGPTGPVGNLSLISITEHQVDYVISMLDRMKADRLATIEAKQSACDAYNASMAAGIKNTTWATGGCNSWYFDSSGKPNLYPWLPTHYLKAMHNPDFSEYDLTE
ncbi:MAG: cation diffusion facilitator CzcD-associated flavoprotein CzcO [Bacteroidia bacterium]|jgi:cation diffusion facilitator CzcD-associated flavoprotein CzcO